MSSIIARNVTVDLPIYNGADRSFKRTVFSMGIGGRLDRDRNNRVVVRALDSINLEIRDGDRIGLIGRNGAGKSTLLQVIAGLREPTRGTIAIEGRVSTLFSLLSVMDPELTGYENISMVSALLGISSFRQAALRKDVEEFTELGDYLRLPIRTYSAGMQVRLSFALLTAQNPSIVLLDEVIGAGDAHFASRAMARILDMTARGDILVIASHSEQALRSTCTQVLWLDHGTIRRLGPADEVLRDYNGSAAGG